MYDEWVHFDDLVHVTLPMLTAPVVYIALARADVVPDPRDETHLKHYIGIGVVAWCLGIAIGAVWELYEWRSERGVGTGAFERQEHTQRERLRHTLRALARRAPLGAWALLCRGAARR